MNKIVLLENQYVHFKIIGEMLSDNGFKVFPGFDQNEDVTLQNFKEIMDPVRICINPGYRVEVRNKAFAKVSSLIQNIAPDLIIIEFKLSSNSSSRSGIDLAIQLRNNNENIPIMFLSQTPSNDVNVVKHIDGVIPPYKWVSKGYSNDIILSKEYFNQVLIRQINMMITEKKGQ